MCKYLIDGYHTKTKSAAKTPPQDEPHFGKIINISEASMADSARILVSIVG